MLPAARAIPLHTAAPVVDGCDPTKPGCSYDFTPVSELDYCSQSHSGGTGVKRQLECRDLDSFNTVWPVTGGSPFFIATRVETSNQTLVCQVPSLDNPDCKTTYAFGCNGGFDVDPDCTNFAQLSYYVADIEDFTLLLDHTVQSPTEPSLKVRAAAGSLAPLVLWLA